MIISLSKIIVAGGATQKTFFCLLTTLYTANTLSTNLLSLPPNSPGVRYLIAKNSSPTIGSLSTNPIPSKTLIVPVIQDVNIFSCILLFNKLNL